MTDRTTQRSPDSPVDLTGSTWKGTLIRTIKGFSRDDLTDWAAALTYYAILSIFPSLLALVSVLGLIGPSATQPLLDNVQTAAPGPAKEILTGAIESLQANQSGAGVVFVIGLLGALWSASGYVAAFMRASNSIYEVPEGRPIWKTIPVRLGITLVLLLLLLVSAIMVVFTGPLAEQAGSLIGVSDSLLTVWDIAKWPVLIVIVSFMLSILYYAAPNVRQPGFRWVTPGGIVAVLLWIVASAAFAFYVANFGSYNKTYGTLGGVIAFLTWLWITNIAVLLGAELDAELERGRQIETGLHPDHEPFVEPRDTRKMDEDEAARFQHAEDGDPHDARRR
jgi:membrane protein